MNSERLVCLSAFTGAGGLDLGLEAAGFTTVGCIDSDPTCRETLAHNRSNWPLIEPTDICEASTSIKPSDLGIRRRRLDLLAGGPPCQPFSMAAQWTARGRSGLDDQRASSIDGFLGLVDSFLPKAILIENVPGFVSGTTNSVPYLEQALRSVNERNSTSYRLQKRIVNAADYGVPQTRRRAILVAFRNGEDMLWPMETHKERPTRAGDVLSNLPLGDSVPPTGRWLDLLPSIPEGRNYLWHTIRGGGLELFGYRTRYWSFLLKLSRELPSWTISASPGPSTGPFHWDNRPLTVPERLRLQSFPRSWRLLGRLRDQIRQSGNATPPLLAEHLGRSVAEVLTGSETSSRPKFHISRKRKLPPKVSLQQVPDNHLKRVGKHSAHPGAGLGPSPLPKSTL